MCSFFNKEREILVLVSILLTFITRLIHVKKIDPVMKMIQSPNDPIIIDLILVILLEAFESFCSQIDVYQRQVAYYTKNAFKIKMKYAMQIMQFLLSM